MWVDGYRETRACAEAAAAASHLLQVAYWRRYVPELQALRARIANGEFGDILAVHCYQWDQTPPPSEFLRSSGGVFVDMGVHEFDRYPMADSSRDREVESGAFTVVRPYRGR